MRFVEALEFGIGPGSLFHRRLVGVGLDARFLVISCGVRMPATTSALRIDENSPYSFFSPVDGLRVKATPVADVSPMLPNHGLHIDRGDPLFREMCSLR